MTRAELIVKFRWYNDAPTQADRDAAAAMLEADGDYRAVSHEASVCREIARQQTDTVNRLSAECDALTAQLDEARALLAEVATCMNGWDHFAVTGSGGRIVRISGDLWDRLQRAAKS